MLIKKWLLIGLIIRIGIFATEGDVYFESTLFQRAILHYVKQDDPSPATKERLAAALFAIGDDASLSQLAGEDSIDIRFLQGLAEARQKHYDEAKATFQSCLEAKPTWFAPRLALAFLRREQGQKEEAEKLLLASSEQAESLLWLAAWALEDHQPARGLKWLSNQPINDAVSLVKGQLLLQEGNPEMALSYLHDPYLRGVLYLEWGPEHWEDAIAAFRKAECKKKLAVALTREGRRTNNLTLLEEARLLVEPSDPIAIESLSTYEEREQAYRSQLEGEDVPELWYQRGMNALLEAESGGDVSLFQHAALCFSHVPEKSAKEARCAARAVFHLEPKEIASMLEKHDQDPESHYLLGFLQGLNEDPAACRTLEGVAKRFPDSPLAPLALYWAGRWHKTAEEKKNSFELVYYRYPNSPLAAEAYFLVYPFSHYLQGEKAPLKHLAALPKLFPDSPFSIEAYYLIALDHLRSTSARHRQNRPAAMEALEAGLERYKTLQPTDPHWKRRAQEARLEQGLINQAISEETSGAKKQIHNEYACQILSQLEAELEGPLWEECHYALYRAYLPLHPNQAETTFQKGINRYQKLQKERGFYLAKIWIERGKSLTDPEKALIAFQAAEKADGGHFLSTEDKLALLIEESHCLKELGRYDEAMLFLSRVINENAISGLRVKAMWLRVELYEKEGRFELAQRQLDATASKGGPFAELSKEKLKKEYPRDR